MAKKWHYTQGWLYVVFVKLCPSASLTSNMENSLLQTRADLSSPVWASAHLTDLLESKLVPFLNASSFVVRLHVFIVLFCLPAWWSRDLTEVHRSAPLWDCRGALCFPSAYIKAPICVLAGGSMGRSGEARWEDVRGGGLASIRFPPHPFFCHTTCRHWTVRFVVPAVVLQNGTAQNRVSGAEHVC